MANDRPVIVRQLPESLNSPEAETFFSRVRELLNETQPHIVFDFAQVRELNATGVQMLLLCLEGVMKRNGDLKLAAVPAGPAVMLELTGVDRLFEIFESAADAVESFHRPLHEFEQAQSFYADEAPPDGATAGCMAD